MYHLQKMQNSPTDHIDGERVIVAFPDRRILYKNGFHHCVYACGKIYEHGGCALSLVIVNPNGELTSTGRTLMEKCRPLSGNAFVPVFIHNTKKFELWSVDWFLGLEAEPNYNTD